MIEWLNHYFEEAAHGGELLVREHVEQRMRLLPFEFYVGCHSPMQYFKSDDHPRVSPPFLFLLLGWLYFAALAIGQVQNAPVTEPRAQQHEPAGPPVAKGAAAIMQQRQSCSLRLVVNADALFAPHRWTLNPDASQTLQALGPMIAKAGKHPVRITAFTAVSDSAPENEDVSHRRAITVRTWLLNHQMVPPMTPVVGFSSSGMSQQAAASPIGKRRQNNGTVEVVIDTCNAPTP
jgi:outer membrane protein OmpA-like peptidoglycan-associated protein